MRDKMHLNITKFFLVIFCALLLTGCLKEAENTNAQPQKEAEEDTKKKMRASLYKEIGELRALKSVDPKIKELISQKTKRLNSLRSKKVPIPTIPVSLPSAPRPSPAERASKRRAR